MPAHLLFGDSFLVYQALKKLRERVGAPEVAEANSHSLSGAQLDLGQLRSLCDAVPFLADYRLVIVDGLLSHHGSRETRRRPTTSSGRASSRAPGRDSLAAWEDLPRYIKEEMAPTTLLVLVEGESAKGSILFQRLKPVADVQELPTPSREGLSRWIRNRAADKGAKITPGAIRLLSQHIGSDLWAIDSELEKLTLYAVGRSIEDKDIRLLVSQAREASIFRAVDALLEGRPPLAMKLLHQIRGEGAEFPYVVAMVARQLRLVTLAREMIDIGLSEREIRDRLKLTHGFALRKTVNQAERHSWKSLESLYERLMQADLAVKQGRLDQDVAVELLAGEAAGLQPGPQDRQRHSSSTTPGKSRGL